MNSPRKANCKHCENKFGDREHFLKCDGCEGVYYPNCIGLSADNFKSLLKIREHVSWFCKSCKEDYSPKLLRQVPKILEQLEKLIKELNTIKENIKPIQNGQTVISTEQRHSTRHPECDSIQEMALECEERSKRSLNLVFVGLEQSNNIQGFIEKFCKGELKIDVNEQVSSAWKTKPGKDGKSLFSATFNDLALRDKILQAARKRPYVRGVKQTTFVNPDLTRIQREYLQSLRKEAAQRCEAGEQVRVVNFCIVPKRQ